MLSRETPAPMSIFPRFATEIAAMVLREQSLSEPLAKGQRSRLLGKGSGGPRRMGGSLPFGRSLGSPLRSTEESFTGNY